MLSGNTNGRPVPAPAAVPTTGTIATRISGVPSLPEGAQGYEVLAILADIQTLLVAQAVTNAGFEDRIAELET